MSETSLQRRIAVLVSGGVDSAVLCVDLLGDFSEVFPIYVRFGLRWEGVELAHLQRFLGAVARPGLMPLSVFEEPVADVYGRHWSTGESDVPGAETPDGAVYLPGRNLLLTAKAAVWCRLREVDYLALGTLKANPFADSSDAFFRDMESAANRALDGGLRIIRPFAGLSKREVILRGEGLPLELTFSCLDPVGGLHCGLCNKCAERQKGFREVIVIDRTPYASARD